MLLTRVHTVRLSKIMTPNDVIRERNGIPKLIELVDTHPCDNVCNSAIVTLRNLAEDIKNKEVIGQYGAKAISGKVSVCFQY